MKYKFIFFPYLLITAILFVFKLHASVIESIGPYGGWFKCIEISKSNPEILYTGTYYGGIYKSINCGTNWNYLGFRGNAIISSIAIDSDNPNYVYFSWYSSGDNNSGVMRSKDGGSAWEKIFTPARVVATSSGIHNIVFVGNNDGVYKSTDSGVNFEKIKYQFGLNNISVITSDPIDSSIIYVGTTDAIYKSTNLGKDWIKLRNVYDFSTYPAYVNDISVSELNNNIILGATSHDGILISSDGGINWSKKDFGLQVHGAFCDNSNENVIYAAHLSGFEVSNDLGISFQELKDGRFKAAKISNNIFYLVEEYTGTILKSTDKGQTWTRALNGISNISVSSLLMTDNDNTELLSIANAGFDKTLLKYTNTLWDTISLAPVGDRLYRNESNHHIYMVGGSAFARCKDDQYETWENFGGGLPYCNPKDLAINNDTLYVACGTAFEGLDAGIYKSIDEGDNWFLSSEGLPLVERQHLGSSKLAPVDIYSICVVRNNPKHLYAGGYQDLFKSQNSGANWLKVFTFNQSLISKIIVDPDSSNIVYLIAGYSYNDLPNTLYKSSNNGESFVENNCGLEQVYCLFFDNHENIIYVGGENGVVRSFDNASTWERVGDDWDYLVVSSLAKNSGSNKLYAGTEESGVYKLDLTFTNINGYSIHRPGAFVLKQNYPNPFNPSTTINYILPKSDIITLKIFNLKGQEIKTIVSEYQAAGAHEIIWQADGFTSGIYFYRLQTSELSETKKLILQK